MTTNTREKNIMISTPISPRARQASIAALAEAATQMVAESGMTRAAVAAELKIGVGALRRRLRGQTPLVLTDFLGLARCLDVPVLVVWDRFERAWRDAVVNA
jgi:hypothetical protein